MNFQPISFNSADHKDIFDFVLCYRSSIDYIYIDQPAGLGDVLYTLPIGHLLSKLGFVVEWPLIDQYMWLYKYYSRSGISFRSQSYSLNFSRSFFSHNFVRESCVDVCIVDRVCYIPLIRSLYNQLGSSFNHQISKYGMLGISDYASFWPSFLRPSLNFERASNLYSSLTSTFSDKDYIFCNYMIGSPNGFHHELAHRIPFCDTTRNIIWNKYITGFTPFDWYLVYSKAREVHTPDTSLIYLMEIFRAMNIFSQGSPDFFMYQREGLNNSLDSFLYLESVIPFDLWYFIKDGALYSPDIPVA